MTDEPEVDLFTLRRMIEHLPNGNDLTLIVLKGHLLIEERLLDLVRLRLGSDDATLNEARLRFSQLVPLARAASGRPGYPWFWRALQKLNSLRNDLAHHLEPKQVERLSAELVAQLEPYAGVASLGAPDVQLRGAIAYMYGVLMAFKSPRPLPPDGAV